MSDWRPSASREALVRRAGVLARIRTFFSAREVLEVETPVLAAAGGTDVHLAPLSTRLAQGGTLYLQTSPEFAMKRLLAAGSGPIYQLGRAFRDGEAGRRHNPEFTMLEWYRPGWDHHMLMDEVEALLLEVLATGPGERMTYREAFLRHAEVDPFTASDDQLRARAARLGLGSAGVDREACLSLILAAEVEPNLGRGRPSFVHDFPAAQAALARIRSGDPPLAERFEVFVEGVELANGYHELTDPVEQRRRFAADLARRRELGLPELPVDVRLLAALEHGLPDCAGVALGVDRLVMLACGATSLADVMAFPVDRA